MFGLNKNSKPYEAEELKKTVAVDYSKMYSSLSESDYEIADEKKPAAAEADAVKDTGNTPTPVRMKNDVVEIELDSLLRQDSDEENDKQEPENRKNKIDPVETLFNFEDINTDPVRNRSKKEPEAEENEEPEKPKEENAPVEQVKKEEKKDEPVKKAAQAAVPVDEIKKTYSSDAGTNSHVERVGAPTVGWLVCIEGAEYGKDFRIHSNHNYLGSKEGDIVVADSRISAKNHMRISFEPKKCRYYVSNFEGQEYIYVNDEPLNGPIELHNHDIIETGDSKFLFMGFCGEKFMWPAK